MTKYLPLAAFLIPLAAHAQLPPQPFCMSQPTVQSIAAALQASIAAYGLMQDAAQEPQRQATAVEKAKADARAEQKKADDDAVTKQSPPIPPKVP